MRTTAFRRPIFDPFSFSYQNIKSRQEDHKNIVSDIRTSRHLKSPYGGASLTRFVAHLVPRLYTWLPLSPNNCGRATVKCIYPARPEPYSGISKAENSTEKFKVRDSFFLDSVFYFCTCHPKALVTLGRYPWPVSHHTFKRSLIPHEGLLHDQHQSLSPLQPYGSP